MIGTIEIKIDLSCSSIDIAANSAINIVTIKSTILNWPTSFLPIIRYTSIIKKYKIIVFKDMLKYIKSPLFIIDRFIIIYTFSYILLGDDMLFVKKNGKGLAISLISLSILTFIMTILNYVGFIKYNAVNLIQIFIIFCSIFIGSFYIGKNSIKKGWLEGIKFGIIFLFILIIFNYLGFNIKFQVKNLLYYLILITSSILGSIVGIGLKKSQVNS